MDTIAKQLAQLVELKKSLTTKLQEKNVEVSSTDSFATIVNGIDDIPLANELVTIIEDNVATGLKIDGIDWNIVLPNTVTTIQTGAFTNWGILQSIYVSSSATVEDSSIADSTALITYSLDDDSATIVKCTGSGTILNIVNTIDSLPVTHINSLAFYNRQSVISIKIPDSVISIGNGAFYGCTNLTSIVIPDGVTSIEKSTFYDCSSLTSIEIPNSVTSIGGDAFRECKSLTSIEIPSNVTSIGNSAFNGCKSLTSIVIPDGVTSIGSCFFQHCESFTKIVVPSSVTSIGKQGFFYCLSLTSIVIPISVTEIGESAFDYCTSLKNVYYRGTEEQWSAITIGSTNSCLTNATITYNYTGDGSEL